ncbi:MAG: YifB family Mg chelatase-like AAA ATPase [Spirochaetota bacterium]|mgnify:CR=1 FL=1
MYTMLYSGGILGIEGYRVSIEVNVSTGMPRFEVVGLPDQAVTEARERVIAAVVNTGGYFPAQRVVINLAPASVRKFGSFYDTAFALGVMLATNQADVSLDLTKTAVFGELALNGNVRPVRGLFPMLLSLAERGFTHAVVPEANMPEAEAVRGLTVFPVRTLADAAAAIGGRAPGIVSSGGTLSDVRTDHHIDFSDVKGQESVKRAAKIAAAGGHNFMMIGPPGCGKTLIAKRITTILPALSLPEALEVTKVYSIAGLLKPGKAMMNERPFRAPHHTASYPSIVGGGQMPRPGEISLAHNGVLFLDEFSEFEPSVLQTLREPMEERAVTITRATGSARFPANFILVAASNPCSCGYHGDAMKVCVCSERSRQRFRSYLAGPVIDRIDIIMEVRRVPYETLSSASASETSTSMRDEVERARALQCERFTATRGVYCNAMMGVRQVSEHCALDAAGRELMRRAVDKLGFTARSHDKILRVARTIADLAGAASIDASHVSEAIQYRTYDAGR